MNATFLEIYASLRAAELASTRAQPEAPARPGVWRRRLARGLVGLGRRLDGEALRTASGRIDSTARLHGSDA